MFNLREKNTLFYLKLKLSDRIFKKPQTCCLFFTRRWILPIQFCSMLQNHPESWVIWGHTAMCSETPSNRHSVEARLYQRISHVSTLSLFQICAVTSSAKHKTSTFCHHQVPFDYIRVHQASDTTTVVVPPRWKLCSHPAIILPARLSHTSVMWFGDSEERKWRQTASYNV